jgi:hypothetical protein
VNDNWNVQINPLAAPLFQPSLFDWHRVKAQIPLTTLHYLPVDLFCHTFACLPTKEQLLISTA